MNNYQRNQSKNTNFSKKVTYNRRPKANPLIQRFSPQNKYRSDAKASDRYSRYHSAETLLKYFPTLMQLLELVAA